ncbi:MAG: 16S rRNA (cytidine(1402)-2'-O)-methyltransferase [Alphaproteobacteria bacterium]|nr:16S rRNA (cytidine(1402)-2'-O)-methyltransferase [Alphaproteobacteria bacterium]
MVGGNNGENRALAPGLYLVATPIGNLRDITLRALDTLAAVDIIACEDRRVTGKLLAAHGISTPMTTYHEHNAARVRPRLVSRLAKGERIALVSDAGTPLISDPGYKLVAACRANGVAVTALPGASAPLAALVLSGLPSDRFHFAGFLPPRTSARRNALEGLAHIDATLVLFESGHRLGALLGDAADILGGRKGAVCRELTKLHEEVVSGDLPTLAARYRDEAPPKGEIVVVVAPPAVEPGLSAQALDRRLRAALADASLRDAVALVTAETGLPRRRVYARALALEDERE